MEAACTYYGFNCILRCPAPLRESLIDWGGIATFCSPEFEVSKNWWVFSVPIYSISIPILFINILGVEVTMFLAIAFNFGT